MKTARVFLKVWGFPWTGICGGIPGDDDPGTPIWARPRGGIPGDDDPGTPI
jgi:hypothetical protein